MTGWRPYGPATVRRLLELRHGWAGNIARQMQAERYQMPDGSRVWSELWLSEFYANTATADDVKTNSNLVPR